MAEQLVKNLKEVAFYYSTMTDMDILQSCPHRAFRQIITDVMISLKFIVDIELRISNIDQREICRNLRSKIQEPSKKKITEDFQLSENTLLNGKYILAQKGKKNYFLIIVA